MGLMKAALAVLDFLKPGERLNYTATAKKFGIGRDALSRRHRGVQGSREQQYRNQQNLSPTQESHFIEYVDRLCEYGLPSTKRMIRNFAQEITQKYVGNNWIDLFLKRHNIDIYTRWVLGENCHVIVMPLGICHSSGIESSGQILDDSTGFLFFTNCNFPLS
jgi:hypothetical protein